MPPHDRKLLTTILDNLFMRRILPCSQQLPAILIALLLALPTAGFAAPKTGQKYGDWTIGCNKPKGADKEICSIEQNVLNKEGKTVVAIAIGYPPKQPEPIAIIRMPLGILLPAGMGIKLENGEISRAPIQRCTKEGCIAAIKLNKDLLSNLKKGDKAQVLFAITKDRTLAATLSLKGFTAGLSSLQKK